MGERHHMISISFNFISNAPKTPILTSFERSPEQSKDVWKNELNTFKIPQLKHDNILNFIGGNPYYSNDKPEYWIITDYHENGSLYDYIKKNILNGNDMCKIAETMVKGVRHLHSEIPGNMAYEYKPAIAHRDFKSQNVLIKSDKSACIANFGFAIEFEPGNVCSNVHVQVGTARYMAPEALEGTPVGEYKHPYEEEVGPHPKINTILPIVAGEKDIPYSKSMAKSSVVGSL
ncbi:activin receptor type-2A-like [Aphidius gifuensis]|uniref:activin receptor type-2A-like n=1 Tax=Aphidius gifuensis TaxID=684658 RepID=UPI001CDD7373|nr:activin receptor type-2A-like [Aphidius gifuensis]